MSLDLLSSNELLVYHYLEHKSKQGPIKESMTSIAQNILSLYEDRIPSRKVRGQEKEEKLFSEATVHRAIKKMEEAGWLTIIPSKAKTEMNEIVFQGNPDEEEIILQIKTYATKISQNIQRLERSNFSLKQELDKLQLENSDLYQKNALLQKERDSLLEQLDKIRQGAIVVMKDNIVSSRQDDPNLITIVIKK